MQSISTPVQLPVDGEQLRAVMRRVPSPVTVVTMVAQEEFRGVTIGSFNSVSLEPALISFNVQNVSQAREALEATEYFAVHILGDQQAALSDHFAIPDASGAVQFNGLAYRLSAWGVPILPEVLAVLHCRRYAIYPAGDHAILVGAVLEIEEGVAGSPVVYYNRTYHTLGDAVGPS
jgi:flavin reductase (DIM6/NTAB) family NADH-FMN oxidoreductase RutF